MVRNGKNPYEIRTELLSLAHRIVYDMKVHKNGSNGEPPTTEEVIAEATKLNAFVSQHDNEKS